MPLIPKRRGGEKRRVSFDVAPRNVNARYDAGAFRFSDDLLLAGARIGLRVGVLYGAFRARRLGRRAGRTVRGGAVLMGLFLDFEIIRSAV
jgi:hypothetical protein